VRRVIERFCFTVSMVQTYFFVTQAKYLPIWLTIFISSQKVMLAPSGPVRGESALLLCNDIFLKGCATTLLFITRPLRCSSTYM